MVTFVLALFGLGMAHGFGADHVVAVATLVARRGAWGAFGVALRFGIGHIAVCLPLAVLAAATGTLVPERAAFVLEALGGLALVALGLFTLRDLRTEADVAVRPAAARSPLFFGGLFALGGVRAVLLTVAPAAASRTAIVAAALVGLFGLGVFLSTLICAAFSARLLESARLRRLVPWTAAVASVLVGAVVAVRNGWAALS